MSWKLVIKMSNDQPRRMNSHGHGSSSVTGRQELASNMKVPTSFHREIQPQALFDMTFARVAVADA